MIWVCVGECACLFYSFGFLFGFSPFNDGIGHWWFLPDNNAFEWMITSCIYGMASFSMKIIGSDTIYSYYNRKAPGALFATNQKKNDKKKRAKN